VFKKFFSRTAGMCGIADRFGSVSKGRLRPSKRLTTEAIDGGLGISFPSFEPDSFSLSLWPHMADWVSSIFR
jgi:hypothetical protein